MYKDTEFVVSASQTNYDFKKKSFDIFALENVIELMIKYNPEVDMVIKFTILVGYLIPVREKYHCDNIIFSPNFKENLKCTMIICSRHVSSSEQMWKVKVVDIFEIARIIF